MPAAGPFDADPQRDRRSKWLFEKVFFGGGRIRSLYTLAAYRVESRERVRVYYELDGPFIDRFLRRIIVIVRLYILRDNGLLYTSFYSSGVFCFRLCMMLWEVGENRREGNLSVWTNARRRLLN